MTAFDDRFPRAVRAEFERIDSQLNAEGQRSLTEIFTALDRYAVRVAKLEFIDLDDHVLMLSERDAFEAVVRTNPGTQDDLMALIRDVDDRFSAGTIPDDGRILRAREDQTGWWWQRIPKNFLLEQP